MRSRLVRAGGFAPANALVVESDDPYCALCSSDASTGWVHVATQRLVCTFCLRDPDANEGALGRRTSRRLDEALEDERLAIW